MTAKMTVPVARRNLFAEKARFAISVSGVALAVMLILIVLALYRGWSQTGGIFQQLPGQLWMVQRGTTDPFHSSSLVQVSELQELSAADGVTAVVPVLSRQMNFTAGDSEEEVRLMALDFPAGSPVPSDVRERFLPEKGTIIIESTLSRKTGLDEGDKADFGPLSLTVGKVQPRSTEVLSPFGFVNFQDAETIFGVADVVNYGMVVVDPNASVPEVAGSIQAENPDLQVFSSEQFAKAIRKEIDESFLPIIAILVGIGFIVGAAVVGLTIYTATIERSKEFGVMKAVGGSPGFLYRVVLAQSAMLTTAGFLAGLGAALAASRIASQLVVEFATEFEVRDLGFVLAITLAMAVVASLVPVQRINSIDPAMVFKA
jgi:putative ABC transport system permease protein